MRKTSLYTTEESDNEDDSESRMTSTLRGESVRARKRLRTLDEDDLDTKHSTAVEPLPVQGSKDPTLPGAIKCAIAEDPRQRAHSNAPEESDPNPPDESNDETPSEEEAASAFLLRTFGKAKDKFAVIAYDKFLLTAGSVVSVKYEDDAEGGGKARKGYAQILGVAKASPLQFHVHWFYSHAQLVRELKGDDSIVARMYASTGTPSCTMVLSDHDDVIDAESIIALETVPHLPPMLDAPFRLRLGATPRLVGIETNMLMNNHTLAAFRDFALSDKRMLWKTTLGVVTWNWLFPLVMFGSETEKHRNKSSIINVLAFLFEPKSEGYAPREDRMMGIEQTLTKSHGVCCLCGTVRSPLTYVVHMKSADQPKSKHNAGRACAEKLGYIIDAVTAIIGARAHMAQASTVSTWAELAPFYDRLNSARQRSERVFT